jgi:hypothetical protein
MIKPAPAAKPDALPRKVNPADVSAALEARARAYLDINCAHCHRKDGVGGRPGIQFLDTLTLDKTGAINARPLVPLLGTESKVIAPGHPEQSELYHRITLPTGGRMPLLGSDVVDKAGTELIKQWILSLPPAAESPARR